MKCGLSWCRSTRKWDGLCWPHACLFDWWGCEGGYNIYMERGKRAGRAAFKAFLIRQKQEGCLEILAHMATNNHSAGSIVRQVKIARKKYGVLVKVAKGAP